MEPAMQHCRRPWWKRPPVWVIGILAIALVVMAVMERTGGQAATPYSTFLDQVAAGQIASVTFNGTEILARLKLPAGSAASGSPPPSDTIRSRVPDFGDPALIPELRKQGVAIEVRSPSAWGWLLGRLPWPMLIVIGAVLIAGLLRLVRGGRAPSAAPAPMAPMHGMMGLLAGLFARQGPPAAPHSGDSDAPKGGR
jgi:ATP-dependent Zn protease